MANSYFKFKQFCIRQNNCAMKVGTDGVLLGAWVNVENAERILDIGSGTGLIALMLAQRSQADIAALEIEESASEQIIENVYNSPWEDRIQVIAVDFKLYNSNRLFDVIVSNPPYFSDSLISPDKERTLARHNSSLTYHELFLGVSLLLSSNGEFSLIIPFSVSEDVKIIANKFHLFPSRQLNIITSLGKSPKRSLLAFSFEETTYKIDEMLIEKERHTYSEEYISLTKDYYLNM